MVVLLLIGNIFSDAVDKVSDLRLVVNHVPVIDRVGQYSANVTFRVITPQLGNRFLSSQYRCNSSHTIRTTQVHGIDPAHQRRLFLIDFQRVIVDVIIPQNFLRDSPSPGSYIFTELHTLGKIGAFFLRHGPQKGNDKLGFSKGLLIVIHKQYIDPLRPERADRCQQIYRITRKSGDILHDDHIKNVVFCVV